MAAGSCFAQVGGYWPARSPTLPARPFRIHAVEMGDVGEAPIQILSVYGLGSSKLNHAPRAMLVVFGPRARPSRYMHKGVAGELFVDLILGGFDVWPEPGKESVATTQASFYVTNIP